MTVAALLLLGTVLVAVTAPRALVRAEWVERAPLLGIVLWQALSLAVVGSVTLAALSLATPPAMLGEGVEAWVEACLTALRTAYGAPDPAALVPLTGLLVALGTAARVSWCAGGEIRRVRRERRHHLDTLALLGRVDRERDVVVVDSETPVAYCLPGRHERVVVSSGALTHLEPRHLDAVLAHERAHLTERHDLLVLATRILARAFGGAPLFRYAETSVARLVEMRADDVAVRSSTRLDVAAALVTVASGGSPTVSLAAGGPTAVVRVKRLLREDAPLGTVAVVGGTLAAVTLLAAPALALTLPAALGFVATYCPILPS